MNFNEKIVHCATDEVPDIINKYMEQWLISLLSRLKVDKVKVDGILNDASYSKRAWRTELFYKHGLEIIKHPDKVCLIKHSEKAGELVMGEWKQPNIIYFKGKDSRRCKILLNYWQLV